MQTRKRISQAGSLGAMLASVLLAGAVHMAHAQQPDYLSSLSPAESKRFDAIVDAEKPLGSDAWRMEYLKQSPRHHEIIRLDGAGRRREALVTMPLTHERSAVVLLIPEDQGIGNWAYDMADQIAAMGYIVIAPDFLSGYGANGGGRGTFTGIKSVMVALMHLKEADLQADISAWADYAQKLPQANGKLAIAGFGWGGGRAFNFALQRKDLSAIYIFYDTAPPAERLSELSAPVYGFYAEHDPRVSRSLEGTKTAMQAAAKKYEPIVYPGSDHMFMRLGEEPGNTNPANILARSQAMARLQLLLQNM
jgi:carboxymethylenebutenolidase